MTEYIFISLAVVQIIFFLLLSTAFRKKENRDSQKNSIPVSVIICARNEEKNLRTHLPKILNQLYPDFEVVVVNDRSDDETEKVLKDFSSQYKNLKVVSLTETPEGISPKKNVVAKGIRAAKNEYLLFTDADCAPASNEWISQMAGCFSNGKEIVLGYSPYQKENSFLNLFIRFETLMTAFLYFGFAKMGFPYMGVGRNLAYKKSLFLNNDGFSSHEKILSGDDDLFVNQNANANNTATQMNPNSFVYSVPKKNWGEWFRQKVRHLGAGKKYSFKSKFLLGVFSLSGILFYALLFYGILSAETRELFLLIGAVRWIICGSILYFYSQSLHEKLPLLFYPILDLLYFACLGFLFPAAQVIKTSWK